MGKTVSAVVAQAHVVEGFVNVGPSGWHSPRTLEEVEHLGAMIDSLQDDPRRRAAERSA